MHRTPMLLVGDVATRKKNKNEKTYANTLIPFLKNGMKKSFVFACSLVFGPILIAFTQCLWLPAIPLIVASLGRSPHSLQWFSTCILFGYTAAMPFYTVIAQKFGRRPALWISAYTMIAAMACINWYFTYDAFLVGGLLIGISLSGNSLVFRMMITDCFSGDAYKRNMSIFSSLVQVMLSISPVFGGYLLVMMNWQWQFHGLFMFSVAQCLTYLWLPETKPKSEKKSEHATQNDSMRSVFFLAI